MRQKRVVNFTGAPACWELATEGCYNRGDVKDVT